MSGNLGSDVLPPLAVAAVLVAARLYVDLTPAGRAQARRTYASRGYPLFFRLAPALSPLFACSALLIAAAGIAPRPLGALLFMLGAGSVGAAVAASYRRPPPLLPRWMRDEIEGGRLQEALPDGGDWVVFWIFAFLAVSTPTIGIVLVLAGQAG
jgi:hypothetical protein